MRHMLHDRPGVLLVGATLMTRRARSAAWRSHTPTSTPRPKLDTATDAWTDGVRIIANDTWHGLSDARTVTYCNMNKLIQPYWRLDDILSSQCVHSRADMHALSFSSIVRRREAMVEIGSPRCGIHLNASFVDRFGKASAEKAGLKAMRHTPLT